MDEMKEKEKVDSLEAEETKTEKPVYDSQLITDDLIEKFGVLGTEGQPLCGFAVWVLPCHPLRLCLP
jgi:hypothetical protein